MSEFNINDIEITVSEQTNVNIMECVVIMESKQEILIRNKQDTYRLSKKTQETLRESRIQRFNQAVKDNDTLYLNSIYENVSVIDLLKMLFIKTKNHI